MQAAPLDNLEKWKTSREVRVATKQVARRITTDLKGKDPLVIGILQGGAYFHHLLCNELGPFETDYLCVSRYSRQKAGTLQWRMRPERFVSGRTVLLVDDILDEGVTLAEVGTWCWQHGADAVYNAVLVSKESLETPVLADYYCFDGSNQGFLVGCGMDYNGRYRNLQDIYQVTS